MKKNIIYLAISLFSVSTGLLAEEPESMNLYQTDGQVQSTLLVNIEHITFEEDALVLTTSEGTFNIALDEVNYIAFGSSYTPVENINANNLRISLLNNTLSVESEYAIKNLYLMDITGKMLASQKLSSTNETSVVLPHSGAFVLFLETTQGYIARKIVNN